MNTISSTVKKRRHAGPGQPRIGSPVRTILPPDVIEAVNEAAKSEGKTRSAWIRNLITRAVETTPSKR